MILLEDAVAFQRSVTGNGSASRALKGPTSAAVTPPPPLDYRGQDNVPVPEAQA